MNKMIQETETRIIGKDVWWDTKLQKYRKKRLNLDKIPIKFRCHHCGKIVVKPQDRDSIFLDLILQLTLRGGVCNDCFYDGFGEYGEIGKELGEKQKEMIKRYELEQARKIAKYGEEPKYWLDLGFTKNPEWQEWWKRHLEIDEDEKRRKNAKFVKATTHITVLNSSPKL